MLEQQLLSYIKKAKEAGQPDEQTKSLLYKNGWTPAEVDEAFASLVQPAVTIAPVQQPIINPATAEVMPKEKKNNKLLLVILMAIIALAIVAFGIYFILTQTNLLTGSSGNSVPVQTKIAQTQSPAPIVNTSDLTNFAQYNLVSTKYTPAVPVYQLALSDLPNLSNFEKTGGNFSPAEKISLTADNFVIAKNNDASFFNSDANGFTRRNDDWTNIYGTIGGPYADYQRQPENSVFISSDFLTHTYHKLVDEEFSYIEENNFYPTLKTLSNSMLGQSAIGFASATDQQQKDSFDRLSAYFLVASSILNNAGADYQTFVKSNYIDDTKTDTLSSALTAADSLAKTDTISPNALNIAKQEITLIFNANSMAVSPLMGKYQPGMQEDYTQFGPRSHYTKNVILRDYFRAMMFYGRMNFLLKSPELTRDAANIAKLLNPDELKQWESIYQPTAFFVGQADDLTIYDYNNAETKIGFSPSSANDSAISNLQNELLTYKNPQIMSSVIISNAVPGTTKEDLQNSTKGFRFMGQRFTPDAFVFSTLTQGDELPDPKTGQKLPSTPTALMVSTLMGSKESATLLDAWIKDSAPNSDKVIADRMATLTDYFAKITPQQWTQNIYWSWLYTIKSLFNITDTSGYPMFVKNEDWDKKNLQTFLGSWTELKHDTLLYAKQSYAELGAGGPDTPPPPNPVPKGYVEPNIDFLDRLIALTNLTNNGLKQFGLLPLNFESRNNTFTDSLQFYKTIAVSELQNQKISDDDFDKLRLSAGQLDQILQSPDSSMGLEKNARSAVIADVHTDVKKSQILYEADGIPNYIYVAVQDANGTRLTKGLVYSYYEFTSPIGKRLTDQDWQNWSYSAKAKIPAMPWWNKDLVK